MNTGDTVKPIDESRLDIADKWILSRLSEAVKDVTANLERFDFGMAAQKLYDFLWSEYCDWYIEMAKPRFNDEAQKDTAVSVLNAVLKDTLKLLHPFMPFITEEIYQTMPGTHGSIMRSDWPKAGKKYKAEEKAMEAVMEMIRGIRNIRAEMNVPVSKRAKLLLLASKEAKADYEMCAQYISRLASASEIVWISEKSGVPENAVSVIGTGAEAFMPLGDLIDIGKEIERLAAEEKRLLGEISRAQGKLGNPGFTGKAPANVVQEERDKLENYREQLAAAQQRRAQLQ